MTTTFEYGKDWTFGAAGGFGGGGRGGAAVPDSLDVTGNLVFAGNGYVINKSGADPYKGIDVKGKIIVVAGVPAEVVAAQNAGRGGRAGRGGDAAATPAPAGGAQPAARPCSSRESAGRSVQRLLDA